MIRGTSGAFGLLLGQSMLSACLMWSPNDPRLIAGARPAEVVAAVNDGDFERALTISKSTLRSHIGDPIPDLTLIDRRNKVVRLSAFRGKRIAILAALSPCPASVQWMNELKAQNWQAPAGYDELVVLVVTGATHEWNALVRACPTAYLVAWPPPNYLSYVSWQPAMIGVGTDGRFEGFWEHGGIVAEPLARGAQPNSAIQLSVCVVTPRAAARVAPTQPATDRRR